MADTFQKATGSHAFDTEADAIEFLINQGSASDSAGYKRYSEIYKQLVPIMGNEFERAKALAESGDEDAFRTEVYSATTAFLSAGISIALAFTPDGAKNLMIERMLENFKCQAKEQLGEDGA